MVSDNSPVLDKTRVAASFGASAATYEEHAVIQKKVSVRLISLLSEQGAGTFGRALEVGCCTGFLTEELVRKHSVGTLYINDLVRDFCQVTQNRIEKHVDHTGLLDGDIEAVALPENLDLVISSSTLQWIVDLNRLFERISLALSPGGICAFSIFGPGTMAEIGELTGRCLRYLSLEKILDIVSRTMTVSLGFEERHVLHFPSVRGVLRHIKATGVGGLGQKHKWTHTQLRQFEEDYMRKYGSDQGLPVTYHSIYVIAGKTGEER